MLALVKRQSLEGVHEIFAASLQLLDLSKVSHDDATLIDLGVFNRAVFRWHGDVIILITDSKDVG
jgi:hypothetical protein